MEFRDIYTYENGKKIEYAGYGAEGTLDFKDFYKYDSQGNTIEYIGYDASGQMEFREASAYDQSGNEIERIRYKADGSIDYKDVYMLRRFMNSQGKIYPPKKHKTCARHQRALAQAIKRARVMALVPFVIK